VIVHVRGIDPKVVARRLNDRNELQALEGDEEVNTFDRRVEWNVEVVHAVVEPAAGASHSFCVAHRGRHLVADPCEFGRLEQQHLATGCFGGPYERGTHLPRAGPPGLISWLLRQRIHTK
jgi:hypothetical protein